MYGVTKTVGLAAILLIAGCASFEPLREQTNDQRLAMFKGLSGAYRVVDARQNINKYDSMTVSLADRNGSLIASTGGAKKTFTLVRCEMANQAQASNKGKPVESVEDLVRCDVASDYKYAQFYVGKVKSDYVIKDQAVIKQFDPININAGYLLELKLSPGGSITINASK